MIPQCLHRYDIEGDQCGCAATHKLLHSGRVSLTTCGICPYREVPSPDFFEATAELSAKQQRAGLVNIRSGPCGHCPDETRENDKVTVVWVYWQPAAKSDELRYSIRSVVENLSGVANLVVCGDKPHWYTGEFIRCRRLLARRSRRLYGSTRFRKWSDSIQKLQAIIDSPLVTERFLWLYDDTFILRSLSMSELAAPRAGGNIRISRRPLRHSWREVRRRTAKELISRDLPSRDYSTHYPTVFEKQKLLRVIAEFNLPQAPRLIETLYGNRYFSAPETTHGMFQYCRRVPDGWHPKNVPVVNIGQFTAAAAAAIRPLFPTPAQCELPSRPITRK